MALSLFTADPTFSQIERAMDRAFDRAFNGLVPSITRGCAPAATGTGYTSFACDIVEHPDKYLVVADVPGLSEQDLKVELLPGKVLQVSGQRATQQESKDGKYWRQERSSMKFSRSFTLPDDAEVDAINAHLENGVLSLKVPKVAPAPKPEPRRIPIQAVSQQHAAPTA